MTARILHRFTVRGAGAHGRGVAHVVHARRIVQAEVAEVIAAEPVPKSKKLLKLTVSLGAEGRAAVERLFGEAYRRGLVPAVPPLDPV